MLNEVSKEDQRWIEAKAILLDIQANNKIVLALLDRLLSGSQEVQHPLIGLPFSCNVGPTELKRAADLIRGMGSKSGDDVADDGAQEER